MDNTVGMKSVQLSWPTDKPAITIRFVQKGEGVANIPNTSQAIQVRGIDYAKKPLTAITVYIKRINASPTYQISIKAPYD